MRQPGHHKYFPASIGYYLLFLTSCDPAMTGVMMQTLSNNNGCDSLVITTTSFYFQIRL
ncbi:MAG: hypothetical protein IPP15_12040 [Saprospiraceae bacterium]|uniref:Uncharacterized protein n=1 Tax=Candidatus Opimibacter skivensis TaxID=2982028 RepID=A0A9D7SVR5_9BACT|nr:hypothetical protein [Candidatus Opimibacter skivensis]